MEFQASSFPLDDRKAPLAAVFSQIDTLYQEYAEKKHIPGYAYGIVLDGKLIHTGSGGWANLEKNIPATPQSLFRIASMTKSFTAMAILKLRDEGKVALDDPIDRYLPEMAHQRPTQDAPAITLRDLITHAAGLPSDDPWADRKLADTDENLRAMLRKGLCFSTVAGPHFEYSNLGYALLGQLVHQVTGISCQEYIRTKIWQPLGMDQAFWEFADLPESRLALGYRWEEARWKQEELLHDGSFGPMGGMITSVESFSRYIAYHLAAWPARNDPETGPLKRSSLREMHRPWNLRELSTAVPYAPTPNYCLAKSYGYGLMSMQDPAKNFYVGHSGGLPGFGSNWCVMPEYGIGIVALTNLTYSGIADLNLHVLHKLIQEGLVPFRATPSPLLQERKTALLRFLPDWEDDSPLFAENFFLDLSRTLWRNQSRALFEQVGSISAVGELIPDGFLSGSFLLKGEKGDLQISFGLTPETPSLIQWLKIKKVAH
jgi:CubicO group peptidase (beta-lactamase class C family)